MSALITVQFGLGRLPSGIPDGVFILNIYVLSVSVVRNVIIAIARDPQEPCILIKRISSACIGDKGEEVLVPEIVDPGERSSGGCYHILPVGVVEMSEFHSSLHVFEFLVTINLYEYIIVLVKIKHNRNYAKIRKRFRIK